MDKDYLGIYLVDTKTAVKRYFTCKRDKKYVFLTERDRKSL